MRPSKSLTQQCHERLAPYLKAGDYAIDATLGNGHDTLFLASSVTATGRVFGFDLQAQAIENTRARLTQAGLTQGIQLFQQGHEYMTDCLGDELLGKIAVIMFNLGYLPSGDKSIITQTPSSLEALEQSMRYLKPTGRLSILAYPGHAGGDDETRSVIAWARSKQSLGVVDIQLGHSPTSPVSLTLTLNK